MEDKILDTIFKVIKKTEEKALKWEEIRSTHFETKIGKFIFAINKSGSVTFYISMRSAENPSIFNFRISYTEAQKKLYIEVQKFYNTIERQVSNIDELLDDFLGELDKK